VSARTPAPPLLAAGLLLLVSVAGPKLLASLLTGDPFSFSPSNEELATGISPTLLVFSLLLLSVSLSFGWRTAVGLQMPTSFAASKAGLYAALFCTASGLLYIRFADLPAASSTWLLAVNAFLVGVEEELLFRGILLAALLPRIGLLRAIVVSSLLFAGVHLLNTGAQGTPDLSQFIGAGLIALPFAVLRLRTGSLLPPILLHAAFNYAAFVSHFDEPGSIRAIVQWGLTGLLLAWGARGLIELRRSERPDTAT
jgi:membrane protease YdiL (CAAX protease family)